MFHHASYYYIFGGLPHRHLYRVYHGFRDTVSNSPHFPHTKIRAYSNVGPFFMLWVTRGIALS